MRKLITMIFVLLIGCGNAESNTIIITSNNYPTKEINTDYSRISFWYICGDGVLFAMIDRGGVQVLGTDKNIVLCRNKSWIMK